MAKRNKVPGLELTVKETLINSSHRRKPVSSSLIFLDSGLRRNDEFRINQRFLSKHPTHPH